mmetsp:Transcript_7346/g.8827  ORF Transcript_7346/g.8827 Transcript_7346/m.8827 type:complete len:333 (-) Transcript_7346:321-1319(-)
MLLRRDIEVTCTTVLLLELLNGGALLFQAVEDCLRNDRGAVVIVALLWLSNVKSVHDSFLFFRVLALLHHAVVEQNVASLHLDILDAIECDVRHLDQVRVRLTSQVLDFLALFGGQLRELLQVTLSQHDDQGLGLEKGLDRLEQRDLLIDRVATRFRNIEQKQNCRVQMGQGSDGLHLNSVSLVERVVQNTWRVDDLPARVLVVGVTHEQVLRRESVRLHVHVGIRDIVDKGGFADIGEASDDQSARIGVDRGQSAQMLAHFLQVAQTGFQLFDQRAGTTKSGSLELLGAIKRISILQKTHVVIGDVVTDGFGLVDVAEGELVMISVVEHVH